MEEDEEYEEEEYIEQEEDTIDTIPVEEIIETEVPDWADTDEERIEFENETADEEIPVENLIDTGEIPEDNTLIEVEPYYEKFDEIENQVDSLEEELETEQEYGNSEYIEEIQTELNILDNKEDYYAELTEADNDVEEDTVDLIPMEVDTGYEDDTLSLVDEDRAEAPDEISVDEIIDTGTVIPEGDTLTEVDEERKQQDTEDLIIASSADGGADPDMGAASEIIEEEDEQVIITEEDETQIPIETKLRQDERLKQMEDEKDEEEDENIRADILNGYSR